MIQLDYTTLTNALLACDDVDSVTYARHMWRGAAIGVRIRVRFGACTVERVVLAEQTAWVQPTQFAETLASRIVAEMREWQEHQAEA